MCIILCDYVSGFHYTSCVLPLHPNHSRSTLFPVLADDEEDERFDNEDEPLSAAQLLKYSRAGTSHPPLLSNRHRLSSGYTVTVSALTCIM